MQEYATYTALRSTQDILQTMKELPLPAKQQTMGDV
jgi:hypothetical protein